MFLKIKNIPIVSWSSVNSFNFKPKLSTSFFLIFGLAIFGLGEGLLILSTTGNSPWSVLAEGISNTTSLSIGTATFFISVSVLFLWIFIKQKPGLGTIFNIIIIAGMIDITLNFFDAPSSVWMKYFLAIFSVLLVGLGSGIYLVANLGPGPRDGLMTGLTKLTNLPIVGNSISETVSFRNKVLDESPRSDSLAISIETYLGKKKSSISSSNLLDENLKTLIEKCFETYKNYS